MRRARRRSPILWWLLGAVAAAGLARYGYSVWLEPTLREFVIREFQKRGFSTSIGRITINPFAGVVARDVRLLGDREGSPKLIASVNRVALAIDWAALSRKETFIDHLEIRNAVVSIPAGEQSRSADHVLRNLHARLMIEPSQIRLSQARWNFRGIQVAARGTILNPQAFTPPVRKTPDQKPSPHFRPQENLLEKLTLDQPAKIDLEFHLDLANLDSAHMRATAQLGRGSFGSYKFHSFDSEIVLRGSTVELREFQLVDSEGKAEASGNFDLKSRLLTARLMSGIDFKRLIPEILVLPEKPSGIFNHSLLNEFVFTPMPKFDLHLRGLLAEKPSLQIRGTLNVAQMMFRSLTLDKCRGDFAWDGSNLYLRNFMLEHASGRLSASLLLQKKSLRASVESTINPNVLRPLVTGRLRAALQEWNFIDPPAIRFEVAGTGLDPLQARGSGQLRVGRLAYRGVPVNNGSAKIKFSGGAFTYEDFWIERPEGFAGGTMTYDFANKEIRLSDVVSTLDPSKTCVWIDPKLKKTIDNFRFRKPPHLTCNGRVQFGGKTDNDLHIAINAPAGLDYLLLKKWLPIEQGMATLQIISRQLRLSEIQARVYGGSVTGRINISLAPGDPRFETQVRTENVNFEDVTRLYFNYKDSQGLLKASYDFSGRTDRMNSINGAGSIQVLDGDIFAIPYFGPLSTLLNEVVPGMGYSRASRASATFKTIDGVIHVDDFEVRSTAFTMIGGGWLNFMEDTMNFDVRVNARGVPGILLFPVSKLFEYTSTDKLSEPKWRPKRFTVRKEGRGADRPAVKLE